MAFATQDKAARLRRLELAIDSNRFRESFGMELRGAHGEAKAISKSLGNIAAPPDLSPIVRSGAAPGNRAETMGNALRGVDRPYGPAADDDPGFPCDDCPAELPGLQDCHSLAAVALRGDPSLYADLRGLKTRSGVSLAACIKPCVDVRGTASSERAGLVAADAECYQVFQPIFDRVIKELHPSFGQAADQVSDLDAEQVSREPIDPGGTCSRKVWVEVRRNLQGLPMPPAMSRVQRRVAEQALTAALKKVLGGEYFPLQGSRSFPDKLGGMTSAELAKLEEEDALFLASEDPMAKASGVGRDWPDARGVFMTEESDLFVWINQEDHIRIRSMGYHSTDLKGAFRRLCAAERALASELQGRFALAWDRRLGFLTVRPEDLGSGLRAEMTLSLPNLPSVSGFRALCQRLSLRAKPVPNIADLCWSFTNAESLGSSEAAQVTSVGEAVRLLVATEARLARGEEVDLSELPIGF